LRQIKDDQGMREVLELKRMASAGATDEWSCRIGVSGGLEGLGQASASLGRVPCSPGLFQKLFGVMIEVHRSHGPDYITHALHDGFVHLLSLCGGCQKSVAKNSR
jgi:hypothetical protein